MFYKCSHQEMGRIHTVRRAAATARARKMRRDGTDAEARLWNAVRAHRLGGWKWKRQVPFGPYFLDFLCGDAGLVVEVDGSQHAEQVAYDERRTAYLARRGLRVLRFWNADVMTNRDGVCSSILDACGGVHPGGAAQPDDPPCRPLLDPLPLSLRSGERRS
jgi:very-short-patch-repair endonuclease